MNKELTPLEALKVIRCDIDADIISSDEIECCKIIEKALKRLEEHEKILKDYDFNLANFREACFTLAQFRGEGFTGIEKKIKALEIIKDKNVDISYFKYHRVSLDDYNENIANGIGIKYLTQEDFNLLKEVL